MRQLLDNYLLGYIERIDLFSKKNHVGFLYHNLKCSFMSFTGSYSDTTLVRSLHVIALIGRNTLH